MAWSVVAKPTGNAGKRRRRIPMSSPMGDNWSGSVDSFNMIQQVYRGRYDRVERYKLYEWMDQDSDISRALDIMAEYCTQLDDDGQHFRFDWGDIEATEEESAMLNAALRQWGKINEWEQRIHQIARNVIKYGDWFLFRNPETFELYDVHPKFVVGALVDRENLEIIGWIVRNFRKNVENLELSVDDKQTRDILKSASAGNSTAQGGVRSTTIIPAIHMVHLTMSTGRFSGSASDDDLGDGMGGAPGLGSNRWPFGESLLEGMNKTFKQRELIEDAAIIHRVQRAPSRNVWYIDTGKMRADKSSWVVHNFKNELNQNRVPQLIGGKRGSVDSVYDPISQLEDYYIPVSFDQRGSKVEMLEGQAWENIPELEYLTKKMMRAVRVPHSWLLGPAEGGSVFNDARVGVAYQEEIMFSKFCTRIQAKIYPHFDMEFKIYCKIRDFSFNASDFTLKLIEPDNYEDYKQNARDQDNIGVWASVKDEPWMSKRFAAKKYLGWSEDDMVENERMKMEEIASDEEMADTEGAFGTGAAAVGAGALPPGGMMGDMGPGMGDLGGGMGAEGGMGMGGEIGDVGMGGGAMAGMGGGGLPSFGAEAMAMRTDKQELQEEVTQDDLNYTPELATDEYMEPSGNDDELFNNDGYYGGTPNIKRYSVASLETINKIRKASFKRKVENEKRAKVVKKIYAPPAEPGMGGPGGGLGF